MAQRYTEDLKMAIVRSHIEDGRTLLSLSKEYNISKAAISRWVSLFRKECQENEESHKELDVMEKYRKAQREIEELKKENAFLKKAAAFFAKEID